MGQLLLASLTQVASSGLKGDSGVNNSRASWTCTLGAILPAFLEKTIARDFLPLVLSSIELDLVL
jgi:hypothetical protein